MTGTVGRTLAILEYLAAHPEGMPLSLVADELEMPKSACHRLLSELVQIGYIRQRRAQGDYALTTKLPALGLSYLACSGIVDIAQPILDRLAETAGELVRLAIVDGDRLTWVAKAQGARKGLRYDPDMGMDAVLSCSATGHAWMLTMTDERALQLVSSQGFGKPKDYGPNAPTTIKELLTFIETSRERGFAVINEVFAPGMTAMAAPVRRRGHQAIAVISIAGPLIRLNEKRMLELGPALLSAAADLAVASVSSTLFATPFGNPGRS